MMSKEDVKAILIADDSATARIIIKQCFEIAGFTGREFFTARNGQEAWELLQKEKVDLVLTDLNMPLMDGRALLTRIKSCGTILASRPVIVITSTSNQAKDAELMRLGASAVITKPISPASIYKAWDVMSRSGNGGE